MKQETDDILSKILKLKNESPEKPLWEGISSYGIDIKFWTARWDFLEIKNTVLCMRWEENMNNARWKICIPASMVDPILWYLHDTRELRKHLTKLSYRPFIGKICEEPLNYM